MIFRTDIEIWANQDNGWFEYRRNRYGNFRPVGRSYTHCVTASSLARLQRLLAAGTLEVRIDRSRYRDSAYAVWVYKKTPKAAIVLEFEVAK